MCASGLLRRNLQREFVLGSSKVFLYVDTGGVTWGSQHPFSFRLPFSRRAITKDSTNKPSYHKPLEKPMQHTKKLIPQPLPYPTNPSNSIKNSAKIQSPTNHNHPRQPIPPNSPCPHWSNYPPSAAPMKLVFLGATLHGENYLRPPWANQGRGCPVGWRNDWMALFLFWRGNSPQRKGVYIYPN